MSAALEMLLKEMQNVVSARTLYPAEHPRTREGVARIEQRIQTLTAARAEIAVFAMDDKVVHEGTVLPGSEPVARGLFRILKTCGYDRLAIRKGVTREEIEEFIGMLAEASKRSDSAVQGGLRATENIRLSAFKQTRPGSARVPLTVDDHLQQESQVLGDVWTGLHESRQVDMSAVEGVVVALARTIEENLGAMIPMAALKAHDEYTATHIINVALLAMGLAEAVGLEADLVHDVGIAALLHDVGKREVPEAILNKPDRLTEEEFAEIKKHPEAGARILLATPGVPELAVIVAYEHHIRYDGGGYPEVGRGWRINLGSAITQVADIYDALRTDRPYRSGLDRETILRIMSSESGRHFDPELLAIFFERVIPKTTAG